MGRLRVQISLLFAMFIAPILTLTAAEQLESTPFATWPKDMFPLILERLDLKSSVSLSRTCTGFWNTLVLRGEAFDDVYKKLNDDKESDKTLRKNKRITLDNFIIFLIKTNRLSESFTMPAPDRFYSTGNPSDSIALRVNLLLIPFYEALKVNTTLEGLHLQGLYTDVKIADVLKNNTTLTSLKVWDWDKKMGDAGALPLAGALKVNSTLTTLILAHNNISAVGIGFLVKALEINPTLKTLGVECNPIGAAGTRAIANALGKLTTLTELKLENGQAGLEGAAALSKVLTIGAPLKTLELPDNDIGDGGVAVLSDALTKNTTLTVLNLRRNGITLTGLVPLLGALQINTTLTHLNLLGNLPLLGNVEMKQKLDDLLKKHSRLPKVIEFIDKSFL